MSYYGQPHYPQSPNQNSGQEDYINDFGGHYGHPAQYSGQRTNGQEAGRDQYPAQNGGAVLHTQPGYAPSYPSSQNGFYGAAYNGGHQPQSTSSSGYDPSAYPSQSPQQPSQPMSSYNPADYAPVDTSPSSATYNYGSYSGSTSGPVTNSYSPGQYPQPGWSSQPSFSPVTPHGNFHSSHHGSPPPPPVPPRPSQSAASPPLGYYGSPGLSNTGQPYSHTHSDLSYPVGPWSPSPPIHDPYYATTPSTSFPSPPTSTTPGPTPPIHGPVSRTGSVNGHSMRTPSSGPPVDHAAGGYFGPSTPERLAYEGLVGTVEAAVRARGPSISVSQPPVDAAPVYMTSNQGNVQRPASTGNGHLFPAPGDHTTGHVETSRDDSDAENTGDGFGTIDISTLGGGFTMMPYGGNSSQPADGHDSPPRSSQNSSIRRSDGSTSSHTGYDPGDSIHPFRPFVVARVDAGGTGGLAQPGGVRRLSYDYGDEDGMTEPARFPDEPFPIRPHQPSGSLSAGRPLPATPNDSLALSMNYPSAPVSSHYSFVPDGYAGSSIEPVRTTSLVTYSNTPQVQHVRRSRTDAEQESRFRPNNLESASATSVVPDLPLLGARRFVPGKLGAPDFRNCTEPWALSSILQWLLAVISPEQYTELKEVDVTDALVALFTNKVPTMNIADAEGISSRVVQNMYKAETLTKTEEWVKLLPGTMSGVIFQLTGVGCYSGTLHDHIIPGRCYSRFCQRTLRKINLRQAHSVKGPESWMSKWNLTPADTEGKDAKVVQRQHVLHETVYTEEVYMEQLDVLRTLYRDALVQHEPSIITPKRKDKFIREVFGRLENVYKANEEHLLPQLKYRQEEQGPWIEGYSDIFRQWIRKAKSAYLEYAAGYPIADFMVRQEVERNMEFRDFLERTSRNPQSLRLGWASFLKAPITRLQRYSLLMDAVLKLMKTDSDERRNLEVAIQEVKAVTMECDTRVAEMQRKTDLTDLSLRLVLRPSMEGAVELNLDHFGRELILRGDLQRMGGNRFNWVDTHAILFDHYLVISKPMAPGADPVAASLKYDVSRLPIPMDLLILESTNDPAVVKSSYVKGISTVTTVTTPRGPTDMAGVGRSPSSQPNGPGTLHHTNTSNSTNTLSTVSTLGEGSDKIMYPFKVKHLGRETYHLFAYSENSRREWCTKIIEAKTKHAAALYAQHAEPFRLRVMADSAFSFEGFAGGKSGVVIKGTPVDRAIKEVEDRFRNTGRPGPVCRARVNCATSFSAQTGGKTMIAVGTDYGVYVSDLDNPRGWMQTITQKNVTQIAVLEDFNLFLLVADKVLIAYHLDIVCPADHNGPTPTNDSGRRAPQKLSGSKDVGFFVSGRMKDRHLVFYKKKEQLSSVFKVLEPIYQKSTEKRSRNVFKRGNTEFFREYDEFYIPAESSGMNVFHSSLAVSTARGFEVLTLDKKIPFSVPELRSPEVQLIAQHIKDQKALAMLRLTDSEFLLCYSNCAVYANKHGEVSRSVIMDFVGTAQSATLCGAYLILFDNDFVEIRNASNGRLKQIIAGREIKCLDDGGSWSSATNTNGTNGALNGQLGHEPRTVKFVMQHPESERIQIVVELLVNEKMRE